MKQSLLRIPFLNKLIGYCYLKLQTLINPFKNSGDYWESRYQAGGNSGDGSYNALCLFKADILNDFVKKQKVRTIIDFGCGDGNQLKFCHYPHYIGFDVSETAISKCLQSFKNDSTKTFKNINDYKGETAELCISLDVIYHLVEDDIFEHYMNKLFHASTRFVIIYSSNTNTQQAIQAPHVRHRLFSDWITKNQPQWHLIGQIKNKYPYSIHDQKGSFADFYIYERLGSE